MVIHQSIHLSINQSTCVSKYGVKVRVRDVLSYRRLRFNSDADIVRLTNARIIIIIIIIIIILYCTVPLDLSAALYCTVLYSPVLRCPALYYHAPPALHHSIHNCTVYLSISVVPCGLRGCKNRPAPFPGRMS